MNDSTAQLPKTVFVFVSNDNFLTANNFEVLGSITSASVFAWGDPRLLGLYRSGELEYLVTLPPSENALLALSPFSAQSQTDPVERRLEEVRFREFAMRPSRFGALYAFADLPTAERAADQHGWDRTEIREVALVPDALTRVHRGNMNLISLLRGIADGGASASVDWDEACRLYWRGEAALPVEPTDERFREPLWELLIDGQVLRIDEPRATMSDVVELLK
jgi:hypothetical protein